MLMVSAVLRHAKRHLPLALSVLFGIGCDNVNPVRGHPATRVVQAVPDVVATVGESQITLESLRRAVGRSAELPRAILDQFVEARAYGLYAQARGLERGRRQMTERAILARVLLERIEEKSKTPSTPTDAEVDAMTEKRWIEFDRPEAVITCHAVVHAERLDAAVGVSLAQRLADALRPLTNCEAFLESAKAFPAVGAKITAERLPPVTPAGRTLILDHKGEPVDEGNAFDPDFARGAHQIKTVGAQSGIIRSSFGWHIILLESSVPAKHVSLEDRRKSLTPDILSQRASDLSEGLIAESRRRIPITVDRAAIEAVGRVRVDP